MIIDVVNKEKNLLEVKTDSLTVAEILRAYLNDADIDFAAWRKEHPEKPILFRIESSGKTVQKAVSDAVSAINKDLDLLKKAK